MVFRDLAGQQHQARRRRRQPHQDCTAGQRGRCNAWRQALLLGCSAQCVQALQHCAHPAV